MPGRRQPSSRSSTWCRIRRRVWFRSRRAAERSSCCMARFRTCPGRTAAISRATPTRYTRSTARPITLPTTGCSGETCRCEASPPDPGSARRVGAVPPLPEHAALTGRGELRREHALDADLELVRQAREIRAPGGHSGRARNAEHVESETNVALLAHGRVPCGGDLRRSLLGWHQG